MLLRSVRAVGPDTRISWRKCLSGSGRESEKKQRQCHDKDLVIWQREGNPEPF